LLHEVRHLWRASFPRLAVPGGNSAGAPGGSAKRGRERVFVLRRCVRQVVGKGRSRTRRELAAPSPVIPGRRFYMKFGV
jgi:hypothetical protein